jgi:uncharacterized protein
MPSGTNNFDLFRIRDPIHSFISLSALEMKVVNSGIFQRLRRIRQLAMADLVYPGATHTRFEHSLGVLFIADKIAKQLVKEKIIKNQDIVPIRFSGLLHDLGHGPFSHISENILEHHIKKPLKGSVEGIHEEITKKLIQNSDELKKILGHTLLRDIIDIFSNNDIRKDIVSGPLDADKLDYLMRDAYYAGVKYGWFDFSKILEAMTIIGKGSSARLGIREEGVHAVEQLIMAKHHMTVQVYRHRVRAITDAMIIRGIELAIRDGDSQMKNLYEYDGSNRYLENYLRWWDGKVVDHMVGCGSKSGRDIFERLSKRRLFKRVHRRGINEREISDINLRNKFLNISPENCAKLEKKVSKIASLNCNPAHVILNVITIKNPTYRSPAGRISEDEIQVALEKGSSIYLKEIHWSVMNLPNVEDKQQYIEVYAAGDNWSNKSAMAKEKYLHKLDNAIEKILYKR